jgi:hypothetical protein
MNRRSRQLAAAFKFTEMKEKIQNAVFLAAVTMAASFPMFLYQFQHMAGSTFAHSPARDRIYYLAMTQSIIVFALAFLCSLVGFLYSERLRLPGFGKAAHFLPWISVGLGVGILFTPVCYFLIDRNIYHLIPEAFPSLWAWAVANMVGGVIAQEVIARFGLLTIGIYLLDTWGFRGHPWPAIAVVSLFGTLGTYLFLLRFDLAGRLLPGQLLASLAFAFFLQWLYGEVFIRKGFLAAACIHFGLSVKLLLYAVLLD